MVEQIRILIVDDEPELREALALFLKIHKEFSHVYLASDGQEALDVISKNPIDVVITDINMRGMNGFELIEKIKALYPDLEKRPKIIGMSGCDTNVDVLEKDPAVSFSLDKPIKGKELAVMIKSLFPLK
jgi:CheY-like chemotaxis protein